MFYLALVTLFLALLILDFHTREKLQQSHVGHALTHMSEVENPGSDWLGRWW